MKKIVSSISKKVTPDTSLDEDLTALLNRLIDAQWIISDMEDKWFNDDSAENAIGQISKVYESLDKCINRLNRIL